MHPSPPELDRFDLTSAAARADVHAVYREMRRAGPIHRFTDPHSRRPSWLVLDHADVRAALAGTDAFLRDEGRLRPRPAELPRGLELILGDMLHKDPPEHTRLRYLVVKALTPRRIDRLRARARTLIADLLDPLDGAAGFDLIDAFARPLPATLIVEVLGIPQSEGDRFRRWSVDAFSDDLARALAAVNEFRDFIDPVIDERERSDPGDDILSGMVHARSDEGERLTRAELQSMVLLLLLAGHDTTVNLLGNGVLALLQHPEQLARLRADPALLTAAIEEMLRYDGPADLASVRFAAADQELCGQRIARGDPVFVSLLAANRDPAVFPDPDRFLVDRRPTQHIAFGAGIHTCVGAPLARMEAAEALRALLARHPRLELAVDPADLEWRPSRMLHGLTALPVRSPR